jgi:hypothetical protein
VLVGLVNQRHRLVVAIVNLGTENRREIGFPRFIRDDPIDRAIGIFNSQLRFERGRCIAVVVSLSEPQQRGCVPAWGEISRDSTRTPWSSRWPNMSCGRFCRVCFGLLPDAHFLRSFWGPQHRPNAFDMDFGFFCALSVRIFAFLTNLGLGHVVQQVLTFFEHP